MAINANIRSYLNSKGHKAPATNDDTETLIQTWKEWYEGKVPRFHEYHVYNGKERIRQERKSLYMPAIVCQRWADLLCNEKVEIRVDDEYTQSVLNEILHNVNFYEKCNQLIEHAFALGGGYLVQYWDGMKTSQKYISQEYAVPISWDSGNVTEVAFASEKTIKGKPYIYLETHTLNDKGEYIIENEMLSNESEGLAKATGVLEALQVEPIVETHSTVPMFQQIRPNIANKKYFSSPYGVSVYANALDIFKEIDLVYDSFFKEFLLGKKRIFVPDGVTNIAVDKDGNQIDVFDPNDEIFYKLPNDPEQNEIKESNMGLRVQEHVTALETQLGLLSQSCGFGNDGFKWTSGGVTTATQIVSENSDMYRTLKKHELILDRVIKTMAASLLTVQAIHTNDAGIKLDAEISVDFDDSIIEDTAEIKRQAMLELNVGLIDAVEYYKRVYKMTEQQAIAFMESIQARQTPPEGEEEPEGDDAEETNGEPEEAEGEEQENEGGTEGDEEENKDDAEDEEPAEKDEDEEEDEETEKDKESKKKKGAVNDRPAAKSFS